jgi:hypothetical protein
LVGVLVQLWKEPPLHPDTIVQWPRAHKNRESDAASSQQLCIAEVCVDSRGQAP